MNYLPPFVVEGTHRLSAEELDRKAVHYARLLTLFMNGEMDISQLDPNGFLNQYIYQGS